MELIKNLRIERVKHNQYAITILWYNFFINFNFIVLAAMILFSIVTNCIA